MITRESPEYRAWVIEVKKRSGSKCKFCKATGKLHAHHIFPMSKFPNLAIDISNGICLCNQCHDLIHGGRFKWKK